MRNQGHRLTKAKSAVLDALYHDDLHRTADEVVQLVQNAHPRVAVSTIYRILDEFEDLALVEHTHLGHGAAVYHLRGPRHAHVTCARCQHSFEVPAAAFDQVAVLLSTTIDFELDRHHVALSGLCHDCRHAEP
jgi:Fe2+ or Zn2+ uptake regulation protein